MRTALREAVADPNNMPKRPVPPHLRAWESQGRLSAPILAPSTPVQAASRLVQEGRASPAVELLLESVKPWSPSRHELFPQAA
eukprot:3857219-Prymnesium_polylepis.1